MAPLTAPTGFRGSFHTEHDARCAYSQGAGPYRIVPDAIAIPADTEDLIALVRAARAEGHPLVPRGAGSGMPGGNVGRGILVDLHLFRRPMRVSAEGRANVGAAVTWAALQAAAHRSGMRLPPDPSSGVFCTLGGMVATNAAGPHSVRYGSVRRWVRGVELVTADGEVGWLGRSEQTHRRTPRGQRAQLQAPLAAIERFENATRPDIERMAETVRARFPRTSKNSSGYALDAYLESGDVLDLIIGSEGTLGIVTRVEFMLDPIPAARAAVLLTLSDVKNVSDVVRAIKAYDPSVIELFDRTFLQLARIDGYALRDADAALLVECERNSDAAARGAVGDVVRATRPWCTHVETALTEEELGRVWNIRHAASPRLARLPPTRRSLQIIEDGCVPVASLGDYLLRVRAAAKKRGVEVVAFGHAGDGHLHVNALADTTDTTFATRLAGLLEDVTSDIVQLGGTVSGEHGDGRLRAGLLPRTYGREIHELFTSVKRAFDPSGILNPGVIVGSADPLSHLKVGPHAEEVPPSVERILREMEIEGRWSTPQLPTPESLPRADDGSAA